ncbi:hypothetical protein ES703_10076 [subsurface metagenome]
MIYLGPEVDHLTELITRLDEERFLEYKESCPWEDLKFKIAKTCMGMANIRHGGTIIIGIRKTDGEYDPEGMTDEHIETYNTDDIQAFISRFADPYVRIELYLKEWDSKKFLIIVVHEFDEIPVVCKSDSDITRIGAIYTRSYRMNETCKVQSQTEMREIIEMATEKGFRHFIRTIHRMGVSIDKISRLTDEETFRRQREEL